ncbi:MAG: hypothetical protein ACREM3_30890, partial [Candidatus Rokuibacteriota bacterium]
MTHYRLAGELEGLLSRSFPDPGDADKIRAIFADALADDRWTCRSAGRATAFCSATPWPSWPRAETEAPHAHRRPPVSDPPALPLAR